MPVLDLSQDPPLACRIDIRSIRMVLSHVRPEKTDGGEIELSDLGVLDLVSFEHSNDTGLAQLATHFYSFRSSIR